MSEEIRNSSNYSDSESIVRDWMTRDPFTVKPDSTVEEAINILDVHDIFSVPVVDSDGIYLGLVTKTVLMQLFLKDKSLDTRVDAVMTRDA
ncbi:MAG: CBS domain-containing protein, partial [Youngiibacter sp.]|nr:CBS domain-containing protein [Youngiibacter sp.]